MNCALMTQSGPRGEETEHLKTMEKLWFENCWEMSRSVQ